MGKLFEEVIETVMTNEVEDGMHDLWRKTIMKFYNKMLGGRDYSIFEVLHFGLNLPGTISSFGNVDSCSVSNWSTLKHPQALAKLKKNERCNNLSKLELFNIRAELDRPSHVQPEDLQNISFYAFWRMYYVKNNRIVQRQKEKFIAINGAGWPRQAKVTHQNHKEYAKKTLYAYMPCHGNSGTEYIDVVIKAHFNGNYAKALEAFVHDSLNKWCPTWIRRNYDVQNSDEAHDQDAIAISKKFVFVDSDPEDDSSQKEKQETDREHELPTGCNDDQRILRYSNMQRLPLDQGEPKRQDTNDDQEAQHDRDYWNSAEREKWQLHSALGPNINAQGFVYKPEPLQETVNPIDFDYSEAAKGIDIEDLKVRWEKLQEDYPEYSDESLKKDNLDEYQLFFVTLVLDHVERILDAWRQNMPEPEPLRLMLLGTAGTGKSTATKTLLQELRRRLKNHDLEAEFVKVAAPTGTAAFNVRFNATTIHRLIHWFTPKFWSEISDEQKLFKLQKQLGQTRLVVIDEISMVGRTMMGRIAYFK